jgi:hypothetical protein
MKMTRRGFFTGIAQAAAISVAAAAAPAIVTREHSKVSQDELATSIISNVAWLENPPRGQAQTFAVAFFRDSTLVADRVRS